MRSLERTTITLAVASLLLAACGAGAGAGAGASPERTHQVITPAPATPQASVGAMDAAVVTGVETITGDDPGTETTEHGILHLRGETVYATDETSDPRVSGKETITLNVDAVDDVGWQWATTVLENDGGSWEGVCTGAGWNDGNAGDVTCWFTGNGPYAGLTYYMHVTSVGMGGTINGVISTLPAPAS